jgi:hypothetical protein
MARFLIARIECPALRPPARVVTTASRSSAYPRLTSGAAARSGRPFKGEEPETRKKCAARCRLRIDGGNCPRRNDRRRQMEYCTCMNNKMSDDETQSITQWEKTHVAERKACDREAGWK